MEEEVVEVLVLLVVMHHFLTQHLQAVGGAGGAGLQLLIGGPSSFTGAKYTKSWTR